ncbi:hypothetical protein MSC49_39040 (plasmid) [Methylosinus sp. C49]|uniref:hypothetical protein n=1 Tax=Methylosinus sp. C49 TaxID=2699395 RepID=UPI0013674EEA|nr:hypothetical protein [Methylosinus sp. C49]BBU63969.1 hypothetical protein MSC49_39040 [Methylosinus sp. C49]
MPTEPENSPRKPDPTSASDERRVDAPNAQHVEELRAELNGAMNPRERKTIGEELTRARDYMATVGLLAQLGDRRPHIEAHDPQLTARIDRVSIAFLNDPIERLRDPKFKTDLAYALEDAEKRIEPLRIDRDLRDQLTQLAASSPGLKNEQMRSLLEKTQTLDDPDLVQRLREKAVEIASKSNQMTKAVQGEIFALSFKVLNAPRREAGAQPIANPSVEPDRPIADSPASAVALAGAQPTFPEAAAETRGIPVRQAEIDAFDDPRAGSRFASSDHAAVEAARPSEPEGFGTAPPVADESPRNMPASATLAEPSVASRNTPADETANTPSALADRSKIEIAAFDAAAPSTARASTSSETAHEPNAQAKSPVAPASEGPAPASRGAPAPSTPANDDRNLAASAARPASPATAPNAPKTPASSEAPDPDETDPITKHEVQFVQEKIVVGGVFGKALGVVGRSASAIGRILEAATPSSQAAMQPGAQQPREPSAREKQANTEDVQRRLQKFENTRMQSKRDDSLLHAADTSGRAALDAMSALRDAPGASILNRIQDAAANNRGGMSAVIEGMKAGGRFEGLREELKAAISENNTFGAAYDRAADALRQYGKDRGAVVSALGSHPNASNWTDHFKKLDAAVGEAASSIPRHEGDGSMLEHLGEKAREIVEKVLEKIKAVFHRDPEARPSPSPGP